MDKKTRFKPASFLEVDDLYGGRKIVMVGADIATLTLAVWGYALQRESKLQPVG